jgi:hypothetical protein
MRVGGQTFSVLSELPADWNQHVRLGSETWFLGGFANFLKKLAAVRPHRTAQFPLDRFSTNLIFEHYLKKSV